MDAFRARTEKSPPSPVIRARDLRKSYGDHEVVRGIDLEIAPGEVFGFLGANGAGKTTTIEILEGYRSRSAGSLEVLGTDPERPTRAWRGRIGLVLQGGGLNPLLTVRELLTMYAQLYSRPRDVAATIDLVGLGSSRDVRAGKLSGGQRRRLEVAVALIGDPELIFLDEPTTGFDPSARRDAWDMIHELRRLGTTVFLTTHYMDEAQHLADRVAILRDGLVVAEGSPGELAASADRPALVTFALPSGITPDRIGAVADCAIEMSGKTACLRTASPQRTLRRLTEWAELADVELDGIEVRRSSLEDVFLSVTQEASHV
jgi:ABC-2 type transport system ATP-binding protein